MTYLNVFILPLRFGNETREKGIVIHELKQPVASMRLLIVEIRYIFKGMLHLHPAPRISDLSILKLFNKISCEVRHNQSPNRFGTFMEQVIPIAG